MKSPGDPPQIRPTYTINEVAGVLDPVLTLKQCVRELGISMSTLRRMIDAGVGPRITRLSTRRLGIRQSHLREWVENDRRRA